MHSPAIAEALVTCALLQTDDTGEGVRGSEGLGGGTCEDAAEGVEGGEGREAGVGGRGGPGAVVRGETGEGAVVVWGSSLGWLVFYAALTYGVKSRGVELLEDLCAVSSEVGRELGVVGAACHCGDMLLDSVADARLLFLASQCWDAGV